MKKLVSLLKASMSQDMDLFKIKQNRYAQNKLILPIVLALIVMYSVGQYAYIMAQSLHEINQTEVILTLFIIVTTLITFIEGIYKSQSILFEAKDNDLLLSLPIKKSEVLLSRIIKLIAFQFLFNALFLIPAYAVYIYFESPGVIFYLISIIMLVLLPIIPTIFGAIIGYFIKGISSRFKSKKIVQIIMTFIIFILIFLLAFRMKDMMKYLTQNATSVNDIVTSIYYPAKLYINLIQNFNGFDLLILLAINVILIILFIYIASISYFKMISKASEKSSSSVSRKVNIDNDKVFRKRNQLDSLVKKEIGNFFSIPVYIINTMFGVVLLLVASIAISINFNEVMKIVTNGEIGQDSINSMLGMMPKIFFGLIIFSACLSSSTSSMISIEGKAFNITKSLPISNNKILLSKILASDFMTIPIILLSDIIFYIAFKIGVVDVILITLLSIILPTLVAIIGLIVNLKFPKMNADSYAETVKQSTSSMVAVFIGFIMLMVFIGLTFVMDSAMGWNLGIAIELAIMLMLTIVLWVVLTKYGNKRIKEIQV